MALKKLFKKSKYTDELIYFFKYYISIVDSSSKYYMK